MSVTEPRSLSLCESTHPVKGRAWRHRLLRTPGMSGVSTPPPSLKLQGCLMSLAALFSRIITADLLRRFRLSFYRPFWSGLYFSLLRSIGLPRTQSERLLTDCRAINILRDTHDRLRCLLCAPFPSTIRCWCSNWASAPPMSSSTPKRYSAPVR